MSDSRSRAGVWVESPLISNFIITLIILNAITLGMETDAAIKSQYGLWLGWFDHIVLTVFVIELSVKFYAYGLGFFRNNWNIFDLVIVGIALVPASSEGLAVLRLLRILRVLRLVSKVRQMRMVVGGLLEAIPGIASVSGLLLLIYYVFAVIATNLFGPAFPEWFGSLGASMYTLFQVMTLESWSMGIARPVIAQFPYAWLFFIPFILIATFTMLNLFIAIIVNTIQAIREQEQSETRHALEEVTHQETLTLEKEMQELRAEIQELKSLLRAR
jgi:voltage-gated sodium channel